MAEPAIFAQWSELRPGAKRRYSSRVAFGDPAKAWGAAPEE
ncbi:MAG: hypothetical protein JWO04_4206 [Gammaproteobacteria bacterium]|nr:hypothetical protein [Gammaproteobacteria bacterium]